MAFKSRLKCLFLKPIFCILFATFLHFTRNTTLEEFRIKALEKHKKKEQILSSLEAKKEEVFNAYKENIIDFDTYKFTMAKLERERNMALKELNSLDIVSNSKYFEMTQEEKYAYVHDMISKIIFDFDEQIVLSIQFKSK